jgi:hypothetical protein
MEDFCLPSKAGKPDLLKEEGNTPIRGKLIRITRAFLVTDWSEGSDRKYAIHSESKPVSAFMVGNLTKSGNAQYLIRP